MPGKKVLVTGGAGFIGFFLGKQLLEAGYQVTICDNLFRGEKDDDFDELVAKPNVRFVEIDLTDPGQLNKLDVDYEEVYHLAAINGTKFFYEIPQEVLRVNILSTINVLDWFVKSQCQKIIFSSSSETYAGLTEVMPFPYPTPEDVPLGVADVFNPRWSYGASKMLGELLFINYAKKFGKRMSIIRYTNVYGPRMGHEHVVPEFIERILNKENPFKIFGAEATRTFCYVGDAAEATRLVMESQKTDGQIFNVGSDKEELKIRDLAMRMFTLFKVNSEVEIHPAPKGSVKRRHPDISKLRKLTGFEPKVNLDEGLRRTFEWYQQRHGA